ncbi:nitroreductase family deazaflavin-dependent oxidoreductase [Mycobacterium sp. M26]|uniref:nitroreductase family deazaflavin-dependent oxidoreductase n=1 Tax=Mycobacterium sp. M26 TaxID=1762962 RepID=UPI00073E53A1|nr:nitroreductase family deazaflavin-dependent oxidoreductase [Mycobacterium sp. M26]
MPQDFPDAHWGKERMLTIFRPFYALASSPAGSRFVRLLVPLDRRVLRATRGKYTLFGPTSLPELLLTTTGRKSGQPRLAALSYLRDGDRLLVLGSNFGQQHHPAWSANLIADPEAVVAINGVEIPVSAALLTGTERDRALQRFLAYPMYKSYRTRTSRELRVFALRRRP